MLDHQLVVINNCTRVIINLTVQVLCYMNTAFCTVILSTSSLDGYHC